MAHHIASPDTSCNPYGDPRESPVARLSGLCYTFTFAPFFARNHRNPQDYAEWNSGEAKMFEVLVTRLLFA
jgi:hypothetical protein